MKKLLFIFALIASCSKTPDSSTSNNTNPTSLNGTFSFQGITYTPDNPSYDFYLVNSTEYILLNSDKIVSNGSPNIECSITIASPSLKDSAYASIHTLQDTIIKSYNHFTTFYDSVNKKYIPQSAMKYKPNIIINSNYVIINDSFEVYRSDYPNDTSKIKVYVNNITIKR